MEKDIVRGPLAWDWEAEESKGKVRHVDLRADVLVSTDVCLRCLRGCGGKSSGSHVLEGLYGAC